MDFFLHSSNWYLISFLIFAAIVWKYGRRPLLNILDSRIEVIKKELETAESLRVEAQELLAQYQRKYRDAVKESEQLVEDSRKAALAHKKQAEEELTQQIKRAEAKHAERLEFMTEEAIKEIRRYAAVLAVKGARKMIAEELDIRGQNALLEMSVRNVDKGLRRLHE